MVPTLSALLDLLLKSAAVLLVFNEVRGLVLAAPVLYGLYQSGGSLMTIWLAFSSLAGIALSVLVPLIAARKLKRRSRRSPSVRSAAARTGIPCLRTPCSAAHLPSH